MPETSDATDHGALAQKLAGRKKVEWLPIINWVFVNFCALVKFLLVDVGIGLLRALQWPITALILVFAIPASIGYQWSGRFNMPILDRIVPQAPGTANQAPAQPMTPKQQVDVSNLRYLAAIIAHDMGDTNDRKAMILTGLAAKRISEGLKKSYRAVFEGYLEQVPPGKESTIRVFYRRLAVVEGETDPAALAVASEIAEQILGDTVGKLLEALEPSQRCVTTVKQVRRADPASEQDRQTIDTARQVYQLPNGASFVCLPLP
ncbi:MAG: hypothetical protein JO019_05110 [Candidatus Kaiserbacteria bacterium]|nr:hypothetical protein [Candidatus Kaiserbacteria bacterium]